MYHHGIECSCAKKAVCYLFLLIFILLFNNFSNSFVFLALVWPPSLISKALHSCGRMRLFLVHAFTSSPSSKLVKECNLMNLVTFSLLVL